MAVTTDRKLDAHRLRADFPIFEQTFHGKPLAFLDSAASSQKPRQMLDAMNEFYETSYANVHRGVYALAERATEALELARHKVQALLNAPSAREVIFVRNATEAINLVAYAWGLVKLKPGDLVVVSELEHHSNFVPWQYVAHRTGAGFRMISLDENGELRLEELDEVARDGAVKIVATGVVSNSLGTMNPVDKLAAWAHEHGAIMVADGAQSAPHMAMDVQALGCDFVAISAHKMCGPSGVGALWGKAELLEAMEPFLTGGHMIREVGDEDTTWGELPHKFEAGTAPMAEAVGFGAAIDYLNEIGFDAIEQYEHELAAYALGRLAELPWITVVRASRRAPRGDRLLQRRRRAPARRRAGARLRRDSDPGRPPLLPAAHAQARRGGNEPGELLRLHDPGRDRPARRGSPQGEEGVRVVGEFDQLYRELILDHYKNPRNHGVLDPSDARAEGQNPLCGDEITVSVRLGEGDVIEEVGFDGRGCAISQAATSMLTDLVKGRAAQDVAAMDKDELLEELGIPLTPVRLKCALLGLGVLKLALHKAKGTPLPEEWGTAARDLVLE